jgi:hypothetical protein
VLALAALAAAAVPASAQGCSPISSVPFVITAPGTYCLTADLTTAQTNGAAIEIAADNVVLDFAGHLLDGSAAGLGTVADGVRVMDQQSTVVRNGRVRGFYVGVYVDIYFGDSRNNLVEGMHIDRCTWRGIKMEGFENVMSGNTILDIGGAGHHADGISACENQLNGSAMAFNNTIMRVGMSNPAVESPDGLMLYCKGGAMAIGNRIVQVEDSGISLYAGYCKDNVVEYVYNKPWDRYDGNGCTLVGSTNHTYP